MAFLNESHPELFYAQPRAGGIAKIEVDEIDAGIMKGSTTKGGSRSSKATIRSSRSSKSKKSIDPNMFNPTVTTVSRDFRIRNVMATSPWVLFADEEEEEVASPPNPMQDTIDILAIVITTTMLMAAGHKEVSKEHLEWSLSYLENVKDEFGNIPPNVRGILNHIKMLNPNLESYNEKIELDNTLSVAPSGAPDVAATAPEVPPPVEAPAEEEAAPEEEDAPEEDPPE